MKFPDLQSAAREKLHISFNELRQFTDLMDERIGIRFGPKRFGTVRATILKRMPEVECQTPQDYFSFVTQENHLAELKAAAAMMISGESGL